ncbi:hypothetical protein B0T10DRAFT_562349 [Thelonectria olida]|uniref:Uncharacterized protein n=1 Tax=Thelonectria olida TaxID=1576542 RepID=A0A9P8W1S0_9HYPO|nr:hypothetical protein B0T10DRAFT_562349 [Thelonectria olida]
MDGTYNNPYAQGQSPLTPDTPSGGAYKVNVNRSKTRKWVEAKVQNYDGDDWGDEYSDEDEPEPVPPPPPVSRITTGLRPVGQRLPSETRPSTRLADITASGSPNTSGPPSLQLQTGQSVTGASGHGVPPIPAHVQDSARSTPSPIAGRTASPVPLPSQQRQASFPLEPRSSTPLSQTTSSTPARVSPLSHPSELYRPEEDRKSTASPLFTRDNVASKPAEKSTPPSEETGHQVINAPPTAEPVVDPPAEQRGSVSLLPDMKRLSIFSSDFFSSSSKNEPQDVKAEPPGNKPKEIGQPDNVGKEVPKSDESANNTAESRPQWNEPSFSVTGPAVGLVSQAPVLPIPDPRSVPPLRTPSPNAKGTIPSEPMSSTSARTMNSEITPTEPLQPRRPDLSPADYEPQPIQSEPINLSASTSSPVKESDMLSDEILRTLSPVGATPPPLSAGAESSKQLAPGTRQDTRSSSYTLRDYDSYWEDSTDKPAPESKDPAPATAPPRDPTPEPQPLVPQADGSAIAPVMSPSSDETPGLRKRFSWEADFENKALKTQQPTGEPPKVGLASTEAPSSLGQSNIQSPKDAVSDITSPRSDTPKIVIPPTSEDSATPPPVQPLPSMLEPASPVSTRPEETTSQGAEERRPSVLSDKMPSETLSRVVSETPPLDTQSTTSTTPLTKPRPIPQVKGVKEIMAMGTSEKRITEYEESRKAFAEADLGLETWILAIKQQHPEFANVTSSFSGNEYQASVAGASVAGSNASSAPAQAPYYQQYLNASSPTTTGPPPAGRSRMGGSSLSTQATSAFGNSSNQIGSKSKELMHSAGKMGKGLFSKGRSKLRGTGDKVFH